MGAAQGQPAGKALIFPDLDHRIQLRTFFGILITFQQPDEFVRWLLGLNDHVGKALIGWRLDRAAKGNFGDYGPIGDGVSAMRIDFGPGYRVYFTRRGAVRYLLLMEGDKASQKRASCALLITRKPLPPI